MRILYYFSVFIHILSAIIWIGSMFFLVLVLLPAIKNKVYKYEIIEQTGLQLRKFSWLILALLFISGIFNAYYRGMSFHISNISSNFYNGIIWYKIILFCIMLVTSFLHDFYIGPLSIKEINNKKLISFSKFLGRLNMIISLLLLILGIVIVRGW